MNALIRRFSLAVAILALAAAPSSLFAQQFDPAARATKVAPFLDEQTFLVGYIALDRIDAAAVFKLVERGPGASEKNLLKDFEEKATGWLANIKKAGCGELFIVASMDDLPNRPPFLVPVLSENGDASTVEKLLTKDGPALAAAKINGQLVIAQQETLDRLKSLKPAARPQLVQALKLAGDTAVQVALIPSDDARRVISETTPMLFPKRSPDGQELAAELADLTGTDLANGVTVAGIGIGLPPKFELRMATQAKDAASAAKLQRAGVAMLAEIGKAPPVMKILPKFDELAKALTPKQEGNQLSIVLAMPNEDTTSAAATLFLQPVFLARAAAARAQSTNNLRQLGLAMHALEARDGAFLAAHTTKDGKPLLSWRVHILPYIEQEALFKEFKLDEPWDSEHNKKLIEKMPAVYQGPGFDLAKGKTAYLLPTGDKLAFGGDRKPTIPQITDGTSSTIMIVEARADKAVTWTAPEDLPVDLDKPLDGLKSARDGGFIVLNFDASSRFIKDAIDAAVLKAMLTPNGGEVVQEE